MSNKIKEYKHIRLQPADNGFVLEYTEISEDPSKGTYSDRTHNDRQVVYTDEGTGLDDALSKMKELYLFNKTQKAGAMAPTVNVTIEG